MQRVPVPSYSGAYENDFCRIGRLVAEAVEVALDLCNKYLYTVTNIKVENYFFKNQTKMKA